MAIPIRFDEPCNDKAVEDVHMQLIHSSFLQLIELVE
jgi:hypothetical protein